MREQGRGDKLKDVYLMGFQNGSFHRWRLGIRGLGTPKKMGQGEEENKDVYHFVLKSET